MKKKYWILTIAAIITILILWYVFKKKPNTNTIPQPNKGGGNSGSNTNNTVAATGFPIVYMQYNGNAKKLQIVLGVTADGYIGPDTISAWQQYNPGVDSSYEIETPQELAQEISNIQQAKNGGMPPLTNGTSLLQNALGFIDNSGNSGVVDENGENVDDSLADGV